MHDAQRVASMLTLDPTSPSGLRWAVAPALNIRAGAIAGGLTSGGYYKVQLQGTSLQAHRIVATFLGILDNLYDPRQIDHIDGNPGNNEGTNLRAVTSRQNGCNRVEHRAGHLVGTSRNKNKWQASIRVNGRRIALGTYPTQLEAHNVYMAYKIRHNLI